MFNKKNFDVLSIVMLLVFVLVSSTSLSQEEAATNNSGHIIIDISGSAEYRDPNWSNDSWQTLSVGLPVQSSWLIRPIGPSSVRILCAGGENTTIIRETTSAPDCINLPPPYNIEDMINNRGVRGDDDTTVAILFPIDRIATTSPTITWEGLQGYNRYDVEILLNGMSVFLDVVDGTSLAITDPELLQRGNTYIIRVIPISTLNDLQYSLRGTTEIEIISENEYGEVDNRRQQVYTSTISEVNSADVVMYTEAWTFYEYALFSEAATALAQIIATPAGQANGNPALIDESPYAYVLAGDSIRGTGYSRRALQYYTHALALARSIEDKGVMMLILNRLANLTNNSTTQACYLAQVDNLQDHLVNPTVEVDLESLGTCD